MEQYKRIKHSTIVYDRRLKKVASICKMNANLSSLVPRHSFTNLLLNMDNVNLYHNHQDIKTLQLHRIIFNQVLIIKRLITLTKIQIRNIERNINQIFIKDLLFEVYFISLVQNILAFNNEVKVMEIWNMCSKDESTNSK